MDEIKLHKGRMMDEEGREIPDPTPIAPPLGYRKQPTLAEQIRQMIRSERMAQEAAAAGYETFEEADDFEVGDDFDPSSPYEHDFDPTPVPELRRRRAAAESRPASEDGSPPQGGGSSSEGTPPAAPPSPDP